MAIKYFSHFKILKNYDFSVIKDEFSASLLQCHMIFQKSDFTNITVFTVVLCLYEISIFLHEALVSIIYIYIIK